MTGRRRVLVVGAGVTGLAAALDLVDDGRFDVEVWESRDTAGGLIRSSRFAGIDGVDEAADAFLVRVPHAAALAERVGVADVTGPSDARAMVWHDGMHEIPAEIMLGVPAAIRPFATTGLLSVRGKLRAALEPLLPRRDSGDNIGRLIRSRFGDEVHERLVDSLIGSIYAADTDRWSVEAIPQLAALAANHRSLLLAGRAARAQAKTAAAGPVFATPTAGMAELVRACVEQIEHRGGVVLTGRTAPPVERHGSRWSVDGEHFDSVVVTTPAHGAARLVADIAPESGAALASIDHAGVIMVRLAVAADGLPTGIVRGHSGYLVPKPDQRLVTAVSFASEKWSHWRPDDGSHLLRVSLGRDGMSVDHLDDESVIEAVIADLGVHLGVEPQPTHVSVTRWPEAFPQYRPHHHERVDHIERHLPAGVAVAGSAHRGIGIPACIADGRRAAARIMGAASP